MARLGVKELEKYLLSGRLSCRDCLVARKWHGTREWTVSSRQWLAASASTFQQTRPLTNAIRAANDPPASAHVPLRKRLKDEARALKSSGQKQKKKTNAQNQVVPGWELTVGIEIHAQLNTDRKLFSSAASPTAASSARGDPSSAADAPLPPNTHVALFDLAMPGSQPLFQPETLIPAVRAALALDCSVRPVSRFDRKHYFHWDQPGGYQLTQYYEPFARDGRVELHARDGIAAEDGEGPVVVGIRQVQMEQDTAKTLAQPGGVQWLDYNRVGVPLVEVITEPAIRHPATAAALVRKVQALLYAVDACVSGMESGGLRADVNVSVRRAGDASGKLGTRTEIKNLSSFKAVEDAVIAERDRQIAVLEAGGVVEGETRGWSIGSTETRRLRGKEGEVDYRYMPDPDLGPVIIGDDLVAHLRDTMGQLPDAEVDALVRDYGLTPKDAMSLMSLDGGGRIEYFYKVLAELEQLLSASQTASPSHQTNGHALLTANWCLHELGRLTAGRESDVHDMAGTPADLAITPDGVCRIPAPALAELLSHLHARRITAKVAKEMLWALFRGDVVDVTGAIDTGNLWFRELSDDEYTTVADDVAREEKKVLGEFAKFYASEAGGAKAVSFPSGKLMFLVGKMMRAGPEGRMDPLSAERVLKARLKDYVRELDKVAE